MKEALSVLRGLLHGTLTFTLLGLPTLIACAPASDTGDGDGDGATLDYPTDTTQAGLEAFLASESYRSAPWIGDSAVRTTAEAWGHGNALRVYFNTGAVQAKTAELNGEPMASSMVGAMAVKEFYDDAGNLVGKATSIKTAEGMSFNDVTYYCTTTDPASTLCIGSAPETMPIYGAGASECGFCHGGTGFLSPMPK